MTRRNLSSAAAVLLLTVFACCSVLVLSSGAGIYSGIQSRDEAVLDARVIEAYITARIRAYDTKNAVRVLDADLEPAASGPVLSLKETINGREFVTLIYSDDGMLKELFMPADAGLELSDGDPVLAVDGISFARDGRLVRVDLPDLSFDVTLRSVQEDAP